ncbi:CAP domain-containing protein [Endothiovibrio diazotrophicus]
MNRARHALLLAAVLLPLPALAALDSAQADTAFSYVNSLRLLAGMTSFSTNSQLETAARGHANYLEVNNLGGGHYQSASDSSFTGVSVSDRVVAAGYSTTYVLENVSGGQDDAYASVDGLMGAIYHRFGFLNFSVDQLGIGIASGSYGRYVYNMGNAGIESACNNGFSGGGSYYVACANDGRVASSDYEGALAVVRDANPARVVWPSDGNGDIPPAFFEESPDPLPDYSVSGYPLSIGFNEEKVSQVQLLDLAVRKASDGTRLTNVRLLDASSDPNGEFSDKEFALFPLERLEWDTQYRADADLVVDGERTFLRWSFQTRDLGVNVFTLDGTGETLSVGSGSQFAVYFPPASGSDVLGSLQWSYSGGTTVDASFIDQNTLRVSISGSVGGYATFTAGSRSFTVTIDRSTALGATGGNSHQAGCTGGVELPRFDPTSGSLTLPVVEVGGLYYRATLQQAGGYDFTLGGIRAVSTEAACVSASFDASSGQIDIPTVMVAAGTSGSASGYHVQLALQSDFASIRFSLASAAAE